MTGALRTGDNNSRKCGTPTAPPTSDPRTAAQDVATKRCVDSLAQGTVALIEGDYLEIYISAVGGYPSYNDIGDLKRVRVADSSGNSILPITQTLVLMITGGEIQSRTRRDIR
eukprot:g19673.t1